MSQNVASTFFKYIGRESFFRGNTLFWLARQMENMGVGRVVYRSANVRKYPEKSYYRLTRVEPDMTDKDFRHGTAWGIKVFRGEEFGEVRIDAGGKMDWILVPRGEEEEFCKITDAPRPRKEIPTQIPFPPLLELLAKEEMAAKGQDTSKPLHLNISIKQSKNNRAYQKSSS